MYVSYDTGLEARRKLEGSCVPPADTCLVRQLVIILTERPLNVIAIYFCATPKQQLFKLYKYVHGQTRMSLMSLAVCSDLNTATHVGSHLKSRTATSPWSSRRTRLV